MSGVPVGPGEPKPADAYVQGLADKVKKDVELQTGKQYTTFQATEYITQVADAETIFYIRIMGSIEYIDIEVSVTLQYANQTPSLKGVQQNKTKEDKLEPF